MIKVENIDVWGFEHAIRGMRNPMNSWDKSDTKWCGDWDCDPDYECPYRTENGCDGSPGECVIGKNDLDLMRRLYKAGTEHRKYLRQIFVSLDITAPLYWWKEFDTYKIGTTSNSCSTMHKIAAKEFELDDFSHENLSGSMIEMLELSIFNLNGARLGFLETNDKQYWWDMIQFLPSSYNQRRTITMNYENVVNIIHQRTGHKLDEWNQFIDELKKLPYIKEIME